MRFFPKPKSIMVRFDAVIRKFGTNADKTGWTYIIVPADAAQKIKPGVKRSYRVKGHLDKYAIEKISLLPAGGGDFFMPLNKTMRVHLKKPVGATITVKLAEDTSELALDGDLLTCLQEEPDALTHFNTLTPSHQRYFSKWISDAKTETTRARRIASTINAMLKHQTFGEAVRSYSQSWIGE